MTNLMTFRIASMRALRRFTPAACLALAAAGCSIDETLSVDPTELVPAQGAINDPISLAAAVRGMYDALQEGGYYGVDFVALTEASSDNGVNAGTFDTYREAEQNFLNADNIAIDDIWEDIYGSIARANAVIAALVEPEFTVAENTRQQALIEAYVIRALSHHNAVKLWGDVPLILEPVDTPDEASQVVRAPVADVYTQILADLTAAEAAYNAQTAAARSTRWLATIRGLRSRVLLYQASTLTGAAAMTAYGAAEAAAEGAELSGVALAPTYAELFDPTISNTSEDLLRVQFNEQDAGSLSWYTLSPDYGGRCEVSGTQSLLAIYTTNDARRTVTLDPAEECDEGDVGVVKYPSVTGTEGIHAIRFGEVVLNRAEAEARQGKLTEAINTVNRIRTRAGVAPFVLGIMTQDQVVALIIEERRRELAFEGDRWPDMVRTGEAVAFLAAKNRPATHRFYPIPEGEIDVAPGLEQNDDY